MAPGRTLNAANLEALGAPRLAELLIEVSKGNAAAQRRLRLALAGGAGPAEAIRAVAKRLSSIAHARTWLDWRKIKPFAAELGAQHRAILDLIAPSDPREGFELLWRLVGCAEPVLARSDDGGGHLSAAFRAAARDLGPLAQRANLPAEALAERAARVLAGDGPGAWGELVAILAPVLGPPGLLLLREALRNAAAGQGETVRSRGHRVAPVLRQVADALGDVDGFAALFDASARATPAIAAAIARRLLGAGRAEDAWAALDAVAPRDRDRAPAEWQVTRADALDALGRPAEAQAFRRARFAAALDAEPLRAFLARLPDFEDFEAEQEALDHALFFADVHRALEFLIGWPDPGRAARLVLARASALDGERFELLTPAAEALDARHPLAATLLRRAMIGYALRAARSARYRHAARHLLECRTAAASVEDFGGAPEHAAYERALRAAHGRKAAFWQAVDQPR